MQIIEVKNDIAKIKYNSVNNHLLPADFLLIEDNSFKFIAQVIDIETTEDSVLNNANLRLCLLIDADDNLSFYNGYIISKNAKVNYISPSEIVDLISDENNNIYFGNLVNKPDTFVKVSKEFVDEKLYIQSDKSEKISIIVKNLISQLVSTDKKIVVIDFDKQYSNIENATYLKVGTDIKLPLNVLALDNILEKDIDDCLLEDKALIQSIILELREYVQTIPEKFLKFSLFRDVISAQYQENLVSGLMVLRNKLWLYAQNNLFANCFEEISILNDKLVENNCIIIDASDISEKWQNTLIQMIKDIISDECYFILNLEGIDVSKKFINEIYAKENIIPIFCSSYSNSCRNLLSLLSKNQILCKPSSFIQENAQYVDFINKLNHEEFIVFGESTLYLPLVIKVQQFDSETINAVIEDDIKRDVDKLFTGGSPLVQTPIVTESIENFEKEEILENSILKDDIETQTVDYLLPQDDLLIQDLSEPVQEEKILVEDEVLDDDLDFLDEVDNQDNLSEENNIQQNNIEEHIVEEKPVEKIVYADNIIDIDEDEMVNVDQLDEQVEEVIQENVVSEDVIEENIQQEVLVENVQEEPISEVEENIVNDISDESVDDVQEEELNNIENEEIPENETSVLDEEFEELVDEEETAEEEISQTVISDDEKYSLEVNEDINIVTEPQNIPVYETDLQDKLKEDELPFKVGDKVFHPKHGNGVVQGFTNYSDKILFCQIEFENVGRRILDPRVAQIEKV